MMEPMSAGITSRSGGQAVIEAVALGLAFLLPLQAAESGSSTQNAEPSAGKSADAQGARARWRNQQIAARKAEAEYHNARLAREIAEIGIEQYIVGYWCPFGSFGICWPSGDGSRIGRTSRSGQRKPGMMSSPESTPSSRKWSTEPSTR
jgi:hypothetical protein